MRFNPTNKFDLPEYTDYEVDNLDTVLDLAGSVLIENAPDPGNTRLERLARFIVSNLGGEPSCTKSGQVENYWIGPPTLNSQIKVLRVGEVFGLGSTDEFIKLNTNDAREVIVALLRILESVG